MFVRERNAAEIKSPLEMPFPKNWIESLSNLLKSMKKSEFQTVDALLAACAQDDIAAGMMLKRVLYWHGSLQREFYLSNQDWWEQCRVQRKTIDRVKAKIFPLCGVLFETKFSKQAHANVPHYKLYEWRFLSRLSDVLGMPALYLFYRLCPERTERSVQNGQNVVYKTDATLTRESTIKTTTEQVNDSVLPSIKFVDFKSSLPDSTPEQLSVIDLLVKAGLRNAQAVSFALLPESIVRDCIASAQAKGKNVGYLIGALRNQLKAHKPTSHVAAFENFPSESTEAPPPNPLSISTGYGLPSRFLTPQPEQPVEPVVEPEPANERLQVMVAGNMTAQAAWSATYNQLELQLDRYSFDSYLRSAKLQDYEPDCFVVAVHSVNARDMLQHRLIRMISLVLRNVVGRAVEIRFEASSDASMPNFGLTRFLKPTTDN